MSLKTLARALPGAALFMLAVVLWAGSVGAATTLDGCEEPNDPDTPTIENPQKILWDVSHGAMDGMTPDEQYSDLKSLLVENGFEVVLSDDGVKNVDLYDYGLVLVSVGATEDSAYVIEEGYAIRDYVYAGGSALILADGTGMDASRIRMVAHKFGIETAVLDIEPGNATITKLSEHQIFENVTSLQMLGGGKMHQGSCAQAGAWSDKGYAVVVMGEFKSGKVACVGDIELMSNDLLPLADNKVFAGNLFAWLSGGEAPEPDPDPDPDPTGLEISLAQIELGQCPAYEAVVTVAAKGASVDGLTDANFKLLENGNEIAFASAPASQTVTPVSVALALDMSGSMVLARDSLFDAAEGFVRGLRDGDAGEIIFFSDEPSVAQAFTTDKEALAEAIASGRISEGYTAFYDAVRQGLSDTALTEGRKAVVAMTDGRDNKSAYTAQDVIDLAAQNSIPVYAIGLGEEVDAEAMALLAESTGGKYYNAPTADELAGVFAEIAQVLSAQYVLSYESATPDGQEHQLEIQVCLNGETAKSEKSYETCVVAASKARASLGTVRGCPGSTVTLPISLENAAGTEIAALSVDVAYDPTVLTAPNATLGQAGMEANKTVTQNQYAADVYRVGVISGGNNLAMGDGVAARLSFVVADTAPGGEYELEAVFSASDPQGIKAEIESTHGSATIGECSTCLGDCDLDSQVSIAEVQSAINMFLGVSETMTCVDRDGGGSVSIDEAQSVVNNYLFGCGSVPDSVPGKKARAKGGDTAKVRFAATHEPGLVLLPLTLDAGTENLAALSMDLAFDPTLFEPVLWQTGDAAKAAGKNAFLRVVSPGLARIGIMAVNDVVLSSGHLATVALVKKDESARTLDSSEVSLTAAGSGASGTAIGVQGVAKTIGLNPPAN